MVRVKPGMTRARLGVTPPRRSRVLRALHLLQRAAVLDRHDLDESVAVRRPVVEDLLGPASSRCRVVVGDQLVQPLRVVARHVGQDVDAALDLEVAAMMVEALASARPPPRPARGRPSTGCSAWRRRRPRRARRRCRPTCRRRSCARSGRCTTTTPPVMYSQPWSPAPSTTAMAPELRTAKRSPATPRK